MLVKVLSFTRYSRIKRIVSVPGVDEETVVEINFRTMQSTRSLLEFR